MRKLPLIGLFALVISGCASTEAPSTAPTVDVTGSWAGQWAYTNASLGGGQLELTLKQIGGKVSGNATISGTPVDRNGPVEGLVDGNQLRIVYPSSVTGRLTVQGDTITGQLDGLNPANVTLKKKK
jgi:hypothetical protein